MSADRFEIHDHGSKLTVRDTKYGSEVSMLRVRSYSRELTVMAGAIRQQARDIEELRYQSKTLDMLAARALGDEALEESIMDEMDSLPDNGSKSGYVLAGVLAERDQLRTDLAATVGRSSSLERTIATLQMRLRRAGQLLIEEIGADGPEAADDTAERAAAVIRNQADAIAALSSQLGNLLAVIHRDGGHYESEHGTERACADAETAVHVMRGCVDGFISLANEWRQRAEQAEARLAEIEAAPTVAWQWMDTGHFRKNKPDGALVFDWRPLIARPAKD